jgi:hypothetical protein
MTKIVFPSVFGMTLDGKVEGFAWSACTLALILWTPAYFKTSNGNMGLLVAFTDVSLVFLSLKDLGLVSGPVVNAMIAWPLLVAGLIGIYVSAALQLNTAFGREVFKLLPPIIKTKESVKNS